MHRHLAEEVKQETGIDHQFRPVPSVIPGPRRGPVPGGTGGPGSGPEGRGLPRLDGSTATRSGRWSPESPPIVEGGAYVEGTIQVDSYQYTLALLQAAEKHGATIRHGTVQGLKRSNGKVSAVVLEGEEIGCGSVVLSMGPWTGEAAKWLGHPVPVWPLKGQILRLRLPGQPPSYLFTGAGGGYVSPKVDGTTWIGTTEERVGFDDQPTPEARESIMKEVMEIMPAISEGEVVLQTACLRPASDDGLPVLGQVPDWEGVYIASGAERKGILLGPAMARATADLVSTGRTDLDIGGFSLARFAEK